MLPHPEPLSFLPPPHRYTTLLTPTLAPEVAVWTSPDRAPVAADIIDLMGAAIHPIAVGGPRSAPVERLATDLGLDPGNDFRQLQIDHPAAFLLLTTLDGVSTNDLRAAVTAGTRLISLEPLATDLAGAPGARFPGSPGAASFAPAFVHGTGYRAAADPQDSLGPPRLIRITHLGRQTQGSLLARLLDAWTAVLRFTPRPEAVTATLTGPTHDPQVASGFLAAHARVPAGPGVVLEISDRASHCKRVLSVLSDAAQLTLDDIGYDLRGAGGEPLDGASVGPPDETRTVAAVAYARCVADQWRRLIDRPTAALLVDPAAADDALACTEACLLSARTGQPEDPGHLLRLAGR